MEKINQEDMISIKNINKKYGSRELFQNLDFSIKKGEMVAITNLMIRLYLRIFR